MKTRIAYLFICLCFGQAFSQEFRPMPLDLDALTTKAIDFNFEEELQSDVLLFLQISDAYTLQMFNYERDNFSIGINYRLEEELPYENYNYDYNGFYYLDLGLSYAINNFRLSMSIDNFLNLDNNNFGIDPMLETSNGIIDAFYFSHESDSLLRFMITYSF